jgi:hypothetical protein
LLRLVTYQQIFEKHWNNEPHYPPCPRSSTDLTQIEAISETTALVVLSELGIDLSAFPPSVLSFVA